MTRQSRIRFGALIAGLVVFICRTGPASAQNPPPAFDAVDEVGREWIAARVRLIAELYGLDAAAAAELQTLHDGLTQAQRAHERTYALTLRSLTTAVAMTQGEPSLDETTRAERIRRLEDRIYTICGRAPMSFASVLPGVEEKLTAEQISAAHARMKEWWSERLTALGTELKTADLDRIAGAYVVIPARGAHPAGAPTGPRAEPISPLVRSQPSTPQPNPPTQPPTVFPGAQPQPPAPTKPGATSPPTAAGVTTPATNPPRPPAPPAPPIEEWTTQAEAIMTKYGYTDQQTTVARRIIEQCASRAREHLEANTDKIDETEKLADSPKKAEALRALKEPIDRAYDDMQQRIRSLATEEQMQKAGKGEKTGTPVSPAKTPAASDH